MDNRIAVGGTVAIFAALAVGLGFVYVNSREAPIPTGGRHLTVEELTRAGSPNDQAIQDAVEELGGTAVRFGAGAPIGQVSFVDRPITDADLTVLRGLQYVREINLAGTKVTDAGLAELKDFRHLAKLDLSRTAVTGAGLAGLAGSMELKELVLADTRFTDADLAGLKEFRSLGVLDLSRTAVTGSGLVHLTGVWALRLGGSKVTDAGLAALRDNPKPPPAAPYRVLDLSDTGVSDAGVEALRGFEVGDLILSRTKVTGRVVAILKSFPKLKAVTVEGTDLTPGDLAELKRAVKTHAADTVTRWKTDAGLKDMRSRFGPQALDVLGDELNLVYEAEAAPGSIAVTVIDLTRTPVTDAGLRELGGYHGYTALKLGGTAVTGAGLEHIADHPTLRVLMLDETAVRDADLKRMSRFPQLEVLSLRKTGVTDAGLAHFVGVRTLARLDLTGSKVTDAGLPGLAGLDQLRVLFLGGPGITDTAVPHLQRVKSLRLLILTGTGITETGLQSLKDALPGCLVATVDRTPDLFSEPEKPMTGMGGPGGPGGIFRGPGGPRKIPPGR